MRLRADPGIGKRIVDGQRRSSPPARALAASNAPRLTGNVQRQARLLEAIAVSCRIGQLDLGLLHLGRQPVAGTMHQQMLEARELFRLGRLARQRLDVAHGLGRIELVDPVPGRHVVEIPDRQMALAVAGAACPAPYAA